MEQKYEASASVVRRLPRYYRLLQELERTGQQRTSSRELGRQLGMTASQIRQDLSCFGCFGQQGSGYSVKELRENLERIMGLPQLLPAILVGAGSLGKVVSENVRFEERGFRLMGIFDIKPELIGKELAGIAIFSMEQLETFCAAHHPAAAVLCLPKESAQAVAERLVSLGIRGLWNFSHCDIAVEHAQVVTVHLDDSLMTLSYKLHNL
ncbi:redox-sensing transcriptional repressor Rex [uncultured Ruminococcus sp.]|uniref:redox-sensing transcriptional repressor Rex n=1 Tax=uncultured Ruminococcus sp. TaxID=165186 RepID=UPI002626A0F7|nr:redox-sensing transcriptional repressor Rex [uncultured Ruminococcus sp.]